MEKGNNLKNRVLSGLVWQYLEKFGTQFAQMVLQIILARLLLPSDYGLVGMMSVFIAMANVFVQAGFSTALIQKCNADETDYSTVFWLSSAMSVVVYTIVFALAPLVALFYGHLILSSLLRVQSLTLLIAPFQSMQNTILNKKMQFKKSFVRSIGAIIISSIVGIACAYAGCGVWSLVYSAMASSVVSAFLLWLGVRWTPKFIFSIDRAKKLFGFGWKMLCSNLIDTIYNNIYSLVIGKFFDADTLGYYNRGKNIPNVMVSNLNGSIQTVIFPALSSIQNEKERFKAMVRRAIVTSTCIVFPAMIGLAAVSKPLTVILLTERWLPSVIFMQLCCFSYMLWPIHTANLQAITAMGRSDIFLKLEIIKKAIGIAALIVTIPFGVHIMVSARVATGIIGMFINAFPNRKLIGYSFREQISDILPAFLLSAFMGIVVWCFTLLDINYYLMIILQVVSGAVIYIAGSKLFKFECFDYIINTLKGVIHKNG